MDEPAFDLLADQLRVDDPAAIDGGDQPVDLDVLVRAWPLYTSDAADDAPRM
jgi:hypothetical protein